MEDGVGHIPQGDERLFFARLPPLRHAGETFDARDYRPAPDDWLLALTDVQNSTGAIERGLHKTVNFVAAMAIAALKNLCAPTGIPFLFGGDGSVVMVPPSFAEEARRVLARVRGFAAREFGLVMRVGIVPIAEVRRYGADVLVGRYEPSPGNSFGVFLGGGVGLLEASLKGTGNEAFAALAQIPDSLDDGEILDLSGLSCRWNELRSTRGKMVSLIIQGTANPRRVYADVTRLAVGQLEFEAGSA